jgi:hypothetical protein
MAFIGSYSVSGPSSSITLSSEYSTLDELLIQIPDNTFHLITPGDLRDSVYTLWQRVEFAGLIAASAASASAIFSNSSPTTVTVGGWTAGSTFPTSLTMPQMLQQLLYPYVLPSPTVTIAGGLYEREYGDPNGLSNNSVNLNWSVTRNSSTVNISTINVDGQGYLPSSGTISTGPPKPTQATHSWNNSNPFENSTFSIVVTDNIPNAVTATVSITWMNSIYWGKINLSSIGNPNLTLNPGSASLVSTLCTNSAVYSLSGAGVLPGYKLSTSKSNKYENINGGGNHLIFAWPSCLSGSTTPKFYVNGYLSTAFTRVRTSSPFSNQYDFITNYEVWVSNTLQNSPLDIEIK